MIIKIRFLWRLSLLLILVPGTGWGFEDVRRFEHITVEDGLSHPTIYAIIQDRQGFLWFGTEDGLNKYDGYRLTSYSRHPHDANSLSGNTISAMQLDHDGFIWIGVWGAGLNRFDPTTEKFTHFNHDPNDSTTISSNRHQVLFQDSGSNIWIGTSDNGLNRYEPRTNQFERISCLPRVDSINGSAEDRVWAIAESRPGILWIGTNYGLQRLDRASQTMTLYRPDSTLSWRDTRGNRIRTIAITHSSGFLVGREDGVLKFDPETGMFSKFIDNVNITDTESYNSINTIFEDHQQTLWIGTNRGGLLHWNPRTGQQVTLVSSANNQNSISHNDIRVIYEDASKNLWLGTRGGGIDKLDLKPAKFTQINFSDFEPEASNRVWAICQDRRKTLWVGTDDGLAYFDAGKTKPAFLGLRDVTDLRSNNIRVIWEDRRQHLWVGTSGDGLIELDENRAVSRHFRQSRQDPTSLSSNRIRAIYEDCHQRIWVGSYGGLDWLDPATGQFTHFRHDPDDPNSLSHDTIRAITSRGQCELWVGTWDSGVNRIKFNDPRQPQTSAYTTTHFRFDNSDPTSLSNDQINCLHVARDSSVWVGTYNGLNRFDPQTQQFQRYFESDGLPNSFIYGILEDHRGHLWMSTNRGLSRFDPHTQTFRNYDGLDGLQSQVFNFGAFHHGADSTLYFGGINGFNSFRIEHVRDNQFRPPVRLTSYKKYNREVKLPQHISVSNEVILAYNDYVISFEFAALDYTHPTKNRYQYKLIGFDQDWIDAGTRSHVIYTNLNDGEYTFHVKGTNSDGIWNEEGTQLRITITPPFWKRWWFYSLELLFFIFAIYLVDHYQRRRLQQKIENKRKSDELNYAREVQRSMLPTHNIDLDRFEIVGRMETATEVGGDYYDFIELPGDHGQASKYCVAVGDVIGHGVAAGLVVGMIKMSLVNTFQMHQGRITIKEIMASFNSAIRESTSYERMGFGFSLALVNPVEQSVEVTSSGMLFPYYYVAVTGELHSIELGGPPLGMLPTLDVRTQQVFLQPGDALIFLSDGFPERFNAQKEMWGFAATESELQSICKISLSASEIVQAMFSACDRFAGGLESHDDMTMVIIRAKNECASLFPSDS